MLRSLLLSCFLAGGTLLVHAQTGCTTPNAVNFDPNATVDDGTCEVFTTSITYNTQLSTDFVIGTAISNQHFAVATHGSLEFGVKANRRFISDIIPINDTDYLADAGYSPVSNTDPTPDIGKGTWDFLYSLISATTALTTFAPLFRLILTLATAKTKRLPTSLICRLL